MPESQFLFICASLPDQKERRESFARAFQKYSNSNLFTFVDAIDGRKWTEDHADMYVSSKLALLRNQLRLKGKHWLNPAAVACALTHRDLLLPIAQQQEVIICEDDVIISDEFILNWQNEVIRKLFSNLDGIVLLHYSSKKPIIASHSHSFKFGNYSVHKLIHTKSHVGSAACYFAPSEIATKIISFQTPISTTADGWITMIKEDVFSSIYLVHPSPCCIAPVASTIGYGKSININSPIINSLRKINRFLRTKLNGFHSSISFFE